jgi:hypothetical protein
MATRKQENDKTEYCNLDNYFAAGSVGCLPCNRNSKDDFDIWCSLSSAATTSFTVMLRETFMCADLLTPPSEKAQDIQG